jgi:hypothetical protein
MTKMTKRERKVKRKIGSNMAEDKKGKKDKEKEESNIAEGRKVKGGKRKSNMAEDRKGKERIQKSLDIRRYILKEKIKEQYEIKMKRNI